MRTKMMRVTGRMGFGVVWNGGVKEKAVDEGMLEMLGPRAKRWVGVKVWFAICLRKNE